MTLSFHLLWSLRSLPLSHAVSLSHAEHSHYPLWSLATAAVVATGATCHQWSHLPSLRLAVVDVFSTEVMVVSRHRFSKAHQIGLILWHKHFWVKAQCRFRRRVWHSGKHGSDESTHRRRRWRRQRHSFKCLIESLWSPLHREVFVAIQTYIRVTL